MMPLLLLAVSACLPVEGDRITAADLARADQAFAALPGETPLGFAPAPGARRVLQPAELARMAVRNGLTPGEQHAVCFERLAIPLSSEAVLAAMRATLPEAHIELVAYSRYPVPRGDLVFPRSGLAAPARNAAGGVALWRGALHFANRRVPVWARVRVTLMLTRTVAAEVLRAGVPIAAGQLRAETQEVFPSANIFPSPEQIAGRSPRRTIPAGTPITTALLAPVHEVARGDTVRVEVRQGNTRLELEGRAERDGARGEIVIVKNPSTGRRFPARVEGPGKVVVAP